MPCLALQLARRGGGTDAQVRQPAWHGVPQRAPKGCSAPRSLEPAGGWAWDAAMPAPARLLLPVRRSFWCKSMPRPGRSPRCALLLPGCCGLAALAGSTSSCQCGSLGPPLPSRSLCACVQPDQVMSEGLAQFYFRQIVVSGGSLARRRWWVGAGTAAQHALPLLPVACARPAHAAACARGSPSLPTVPSAGGHGCAPLSERGARRHEAG